MDIVYDDGKYIENGDRQETSHFLNKDFNADELFNYDIDMCLMNINKCINTSENCCGDDEWIEEIKQLQRELNKQNAENNDMVIKCVEMEKRIINLENEICETNNEINHFENELLSINQKIKAKRIVYKRLEQDYIQINDISNICNINETVSKKLIKKNSITHTQHIDATIDNGYDTNMRKRKKNKRKKKCKAKQIVFECSQCMESFKYNNLLIEHEKKHNKARKEPYNYKCGHCNYYDLFKDTFETHNIIEHNECKPHHCRRCHKRFDRVDNLRRH
eukprot:294431_1